MWVCNSSDAGHNFRMTSILSSTLDFFQCHAGNPQDSQHFPSTFSHFAEFFNPPLRFLWITFHPQGADHFGSVDNF